MGINLNKYGWNQVQAVEPSDFTSLPAGAYVCKIVDAHLESVKDIGMRLTLDVDVVEGEFTGFFEKRKTKNGWDFNAQFKRYIVKKTKEGYFVQSQFKGLVKMLEEQNPNFKFNFSDVDDKTFCGLTCGFIFGEREYVNKNNEIKIAVSVKFPAMVDDVREGKCKIPKLDTLPPDKRPDKQDNISEFDGKEVDDADLPF